MPGQIQDCTKLSGVKPVSLLERPKDIHIILRQCDGPMDESHTQETRNETNRICDTGIEGKLSLLLKNGFYLLTKPTRWRQQPQRWLTASN